MTNKEADNQWISFYIGSEKFACKVKKIQEVIPYEEPIPVPGAPSEVEGVLNVRGEIVPIVSGLQVATGCPTTLPDSDQTTTFNEGKGNNSIIIMDIEAGQIGISIDAVKEIIHIHTSDIEFEETHNSCIAGTVLHKQDLITLLDIHPQNFQSQSYAENT